MLSEVLSIVMLICLSEWDVDVALLLMLTASDAPTTGLEDIQIDVRSKFELFEGLKEKKDEGGDKSPEMLVVKR